MNKEKQRIAIAEACGWRWESRIKGAIKVWNKPPSMVFHDIELPDYINDLNAMHEAERVLFRTGYTDTLNLNYWNELWRVCGDEYFKITTVANAPAEKRAEAFLRTIGKWEE